MVLVVLVFARHMVVAIFVIPIEGKHKEIIPFVKVAHSRVVVNKQALLLEVSAIMQD